MECANCQKILTVNMPRYSEPATGKVYCSMECKIADTAKNPVPVAAGEIPNQLGEGQQSAPDPIQSCNCGGYPCSCNQ